ncbi:hypothetical_protein [Candidozyma auris]|uniref:hypothetical_protein n=1 Tax=Candidozyma auris TaxID=498019 RepID=UPI000D2E5EA4|nr:hypothetical_protein [[Candida] auris]QEO20278.1 hypothetical_protein [[Candida] auris]GBL49749.1 hypothetical protein CAJCM15448_20230 [[Candida] auris]
MCKRSNNSFDDTALSKHDDSLSPYDDEISRFFDRAASLTKRIVGHTYEFANELPSKWKDQAGDSVFDRFMNKPYQTRDKDLEIDRGFIPFGIPFDMFNVFGGASGDSPFGLYSYKSPSIRKYNECMRKDGESVWDQEGYWRCLFPNSQIPNKILNYKKNHLAGHILTKEDFSEALQENPSADQNGVIDLGPKGIFFREFNRYLKWKNDMYEDVRRQREESRRNLRESLKAQHQAESFSSPTTDGDGDNVVSWSMKTVTETDPDTNKEIMHETRTEVFEDGRSVTKKSTRSRPIGSSEWSAPEQTTEDNKSGWFWNSK